MLKELRSRHLAGRIGGQVAVCSAHPRVLAAAAAVTKRDGSLLLVEATANQVNLDGGYTGMTPGDFAEAMTRLSADAGLAPGRVVLGADHLGPHLWRDLPAVRAMSRAEALARAYVAAGFRKLHLDTAQGCADDPREGLPKETAARRASALCRAAEAAARESGRAAPLYAIGTEVPAPGGALEPGGAVAVSDPRDLAHELYVYEQAFRRQRLEAAWERVLAVVVQPGVDFDDYRAAGYQPQAAAKLSEAHQGLPGAMTFEIHAADFQTPSAVRQMVRDHFVLLKVGPCLTFALREALFALAHIESDLPGLTRRSGLMAVMERLMLSNPRHWQSHYRGSPEELGYLRRYALRDRMRYYWPQAGARRACERLFANLNRPIPRPLLRQYLPDLADAAADGRLSATPAAMVQARIESALQLYMDACRCSPIESQGAGACADDKSSRFTFSDSQIGKP